MSKNLMQDKFIPSGTQSTRALKQSIKSIIQPISSNDYPKNFARSTSFNKYYNTIYLSYNKPTIRDPGLEYIEDQLKDSMLVYKDYKELINPRIRSYNSCIVPESTKMINDRKSEFMEIPKREYEEYKKESMRILAKSKFRIEKTKQIINSARYLSNKIMRISRKHKEIRSK